MAPATGICPSGEVSLGETMGRGSNPILHLRRRAGSLRAGIKKDLNPRGQRSFLAPATGIEPVTNP